MAGYANDSNWTGVHDTFASEFNELRHPEEKVASHQDQLGYWTEQLADSCAAEFFTDFIRPPSLSGQVESIPVVIDGCAYETLQVFCSSRDVSVFAVLLAVFRATHYRLTGAEDATIGTSPFSRSRLETQCMRVIVADDDTLASLVRQVKSTVGTASKYQEIPVGTVTEALLEAKEISRHPLVRLIFAMHAKQEVNSQFEGSDEAQSSRFDMHWSLVEENGKLGGSVLYARELFARQSVRSMIAVFQQTLHRGLEQPDTPISTLSLLDTDGLKNLRTLGVLDVEGTDYPRDSSVVDIFREQAIAHPNAVAVTDSSIRGSSSQITYSQLDQQSDELASWLRRRYNVPETPVAVLAPRSCETVVAFLGILKANLSYLPLDINVPTARIETILSNVTEPRVVLFGSNMSVPNIQLPNIESTRISDTLGQQDLDDLRAVRPSATSLAYVIFTSGSTGTPKGVMVEHRSLLRLVKHSNLTSKLPAEPTRVAHLTNIAFDVSLLEMCTALLHGSTLICIDYATVLDSKAIEVVFAQERIRVAMLPPALLQQCLVNIPASLGALDVLFVAGDRFNSHDAAVAQKLVGPGVYNAYGPTENGILSTMYNVGGSEAFVSGVPIGRAVSNSGAYIMDRNQQLVPAGVIGELVVTGDGLARGYTDRNQDVDRFIYVNIEGRNVRAYRTGDRARCRPTDGQIEFFGRIDQQFKIRGHRIEPAEIEQCMLNHLTVQEAAVVVAAAQKDQDPRIVAFAVADVQGSAKEGHVDNGLTGALTFQQSQYVMDLEKDIRNWLQTFFPSYMIPARIVVLKQMPLNTNGKIDRKKLVQIAVASLKIRLVAARVLPRNETEAVLCEEFAKLFGNIEIGITDSFFDLGGHSLMATKLAARLSSRLDARVSVKHVLDLPVLADLAATIRCGSKSHSPIPRIDYVGPVEQSFAQGRMWFFHQLDPRSEQYLVPLAVRLHGPLHTVALSKALHALEQRHETLRTTFETMDGVGMQVVHPFRKSELRVTSVPDSQKASLIRLLHEEQTTPFKLESEPGWRVSLFRFGEDDHVLSIVMHHIISDDWSIDILQQELARFYSAALHGQAILPPGSHLLAQYREFSAWEKQEEQMASQERQLQYWVKQLKDSTPAELLNDHRRPAALSGQAGEVQFMIDSDLYEKAETFCRDRQVTWFVVLLSAFRATHFRLTGVEDSNIGTPVANRSRQELEDIIGFFVNTQCLRITIDKDDTFEGLIRRVRSTVTEALDNQDIPFERIVTAVLPGSRDMSRNPLVQLIFALHSQQDLNTIQLEGLTGEPIATAFSTRFDVEFHLFQENDMLKGSVLFATDLFEHSTIQNMVAVFQENLLRGLEQPSSPISTLPLTHGLADLHNLRLFEIQRADYPRDSSVVDVFHAQVAACPDETAVISTSSRLTYSQLDHQSNQLANWLRSRYFPAETPIAVLATRSCQGIVAFLGILKANLTYLPIDIKTPTARMEVILSTAIPGNKLVLLSSDVSAPHIQLPDVETAQISDALSNRGANGQAVDRAQPSATSLAYIMFTSGSTGKPKGIMIEHRSILRLVKGSSVVSDLPLAPRVAHLNNIGFDVSVWEILVALLNGGTLVCIEYLTLLDSKALASIFAQEEVRVAFFPTALLKQYLTEIPSALAGLELLYVGGERLDSHDAIQARALVPSVYNVYGPTESHICTVYKVEENEELTNGTPIGRAVNDTGVYIMDAQQKLVSKGVLGELVVTGDGLARGYTDPALDVNRFIEVAIDPEHKAVRAYRTGDLVRYRPKDGQIEFFGRMDQQIKIRGHRIELAEVEQAIMGHHKVRDVAVVVRGKDGQEQEMIGFVLPRVNITNDDLSGEDISNQPQPAEDSTNMLRTLEERMEKDIRDRIQSHLPSYMVPTRIIALKQMPLNANGKVDRKTLTGMAEKVPKSKVVERVQRTKVIEFSRQRKVANGESSNSDVEVILCEEFADVLGVEVCLSDNFFDLGGHSLMSIKLAGRISHHLGVRVSVKDIFDHPTPVGLAKKIWNSRLQTHGTHI